MKESAKVRKGAGQRTEFKLQKRLWNSEEMQMDDGDGPQGSLKQKRGADGRGNPVPPSSSQSSTTAPKK